MGIPLSQARLLIRESKRRPFEGSVLQLGKQLLSFTEKEFRHVAAEEKYRLTEVPESVQVQNPLKEWMDDVRFFRMLGFPSVDSLDINDFEGATILHDLNSPIPSDSILRGKFDLVFDGGTMEHVFHTPNFLANCIDLTKIWGRIVHSVPMDMVNHGFYNFSPTLFEDFYAVNHFEINSLLVWKKYHYQSDDSRLCTDARGDSQFIRSLHAGLFNGASHNVTAIVTKTEEISSVTIPMQGYYQRRFENADLVNSAGLTGGASRLKGVYQSLLGVPALGSLAKYMRNMYARSLIHWETI